MKYLILVTVLFSLNVLAEGSMTGENAAPDTMNVGCEKCRKANVDGSEGIKQTSTQRPKEKGSSSSSATSK